MATDSTLERVYRAVSEKEYQQILTTGTFELVPQRCEGKHFADTPEGTRRFGEALFGIGRFQIVEAEVPAEARACTDGQIWTVSDPPGFSTWTT